MAKPPAPTQSIDACMGEEEQTRQDAHNARIVGEWGALRGRCMVDVDENRIDFEEA